MNRKHASFSPSASQGSGNSACVLMFSGGRDSTLSAIRLSHAGRNLALVTATSDHLVGMDSVLARLQELKTLLPPDTTWTHVTQPTNLFMDQKFYDRTCLPCQHAYVAIGAKMLKAIGSRSIALGYAAYQGDWPEQTPRATQGLRGLLARFGIDLTLPVYDLRSRADAVTELQRYGLSSSALEQKCLRRRR